MLPGGQDAQRASKAREHISGQSSGEGRARVCVEQKLATTVSDSQHWPGSWGICQRPEHLD